MQKLITYCFVYFVILKKNVTFALKLKLMERKDYYKILGLSDSDKKLQGDEFKKKVKQNYKKNALKYHPDRQHGKSDEEKIFQVVSSRITFFLRDYGDWLALF